MAYDALGRMVRREESEGITTWEYDSAGKGIGKLAWVQGPGGFRKEFAYDNPGRPLEATTHADNQTFTVTTGYDEFGRVAESIRPDGFTVQHVYNAAGYLESQRVPREHILDTSRASPYPVSEHAGNGSASFRRDHQLSITLTHISRISATSYSTHFGNLGAQQTLSVLSRVRGSVG